MTKIGYAFNTITPDEPVLLAGYNCERWSKNVHDDLMCHLIVLEYHDKKICFVQFDLLGIDDVFIEMLKQKSKLYGIDELIAGAIHTHAGPKGTCVVQGIEGIFGEYDEKYVSKCVTVFEECLKTALTDLEEFDVKISTQTIENICSERHSPDRPFDNVLWKIEFSLYNNKKILIYNYSCHPTILHDDNQSISADLIGQVRQDLSQIYDMVMFYNGSAGDVSTRFTRQGSNFQEVERLGHLLSDQIQHNKEYVIYEGKLDIIQIYHEQIALKTWQTNHIENYKNRVDQLAREISLGDSSQEMKYNEMKSYYDFLKNNKYPQNHDQITIPFDIIKFNQCFIITIPSEITSSLTLSLTQKYQCMIFSYTGGYHLYIPSVNAFDHRDYEAAMSILERGQGEKLIEYIEECLQKLNIKEK